ncbi:MAG TPA: type II toxin-antitoxin system RelE/ParE family toxin [Thermoanaerobaculia bacterium]
MKKAVRPSSFARDEVEYYLQRYESQSPGLGDRLWREIQATVALVADHPAIGEPVRRTGGAVRRVPLRRFPFFIIYRERERDVQIIALAHTSRRPDYWRPRLKPPR